SGMNPFISFVELENRIITAKYRNLMIKAKVVLVDKTSGQPLADPITTISSPAPNGSLRIRLPDSVKAGTYYLKALNGHGDFAAQRIDFKCTGHAVFCGISGFYAEAPVSELSIARLSASGVKRRIDAPPGGAVPSEP